MENNKAFVQYKYSYTILHYKYRDENIFFCGFVYITRKLIYYFYDQSNLIDFGKLYWVKKWVKHQLTHLMPLVCFYDSKNIENQRFSHVSRWYRKIPVAWYGSTTKTGLPIVSQQDPVTQRNTCSKSSTETLQKGKKRIQS